MKPRSFIFALAIVITFTLVTSSALLVAPRPAHAVITMYGVPVTDAGNTWQSILSTVQETLTAAQTYTSAAANVAMQVNAYVLQPLAFVLSGNLMKALTTGVIAFVIGKANSTGVPQFVVDMQKSMQTVADGQALAFFDQLGRNSNSPFTSSINSSLRNNYLSKTSLQGFWAANMSMLYRTSPNVNGYLAGRWSQGGVKAWFALTTQVDNPYTRFYNTQSALASVVGRGAGGATGAKASDIAAGSGFTSWCGANDNATANAGAVYSETDAQAALQTCVDNGNTMEDCEPVLESYRALIGQPKDIVQGVNPGDPCRQADGTSGTIKTPGSVIKSTLDKVLGSQQDQIVRMGNVGPQINQILGNIGTVLQTVQFASQILGGPGSGGLFGVDAPSSSGSTSRLIQYQNTPGTLGVTGAVAAQGASTATGADVTMSNRLTQYTSAWNTIANAANTASAAATSLASSCAAQASAAQAAIFNSIAPVLTQAATASSTAATTAAFVRRVRGEIGTSAYNTDLQTLQTMSPSAQEVVDAQREASSLGGATASPAGSLTVSGGTIIDRMSLITSNAQTLTASSTACNGS